MLLKFIFDTFILLHSLHDRPRSVRSYPRFPAFFSGVRLACGVRRVGSGASPPRSRARAACRLPFSARRGAHLSGSPVSSWLLARARPVTCTGHPPQVLIHVVRWAGYALVNSPLNENFSERQHLSIYLSIYLSTRVVRCVGPVFLYLSMYLDVL